MKKLLSLLLTFLITMTYSQVIINGESAESGVPLQDKDLDVRGNIKINKIQPTVYKVGGVTTTIKDLTRLFIDKEKRFVSGSNLIKKKISRLVFYIKIDNQNQEVNGYNIVRFDTKIPHNQYQVILGTCDLINSKPSEEHNPNWIIKTPKVGYQAVKQTKVFKYNENWAFSVNYTSKTNVVSYWRVTLYVINNYYTKTYDGTSPSTILFTQPAYEEINEGVGVGTDTPTQTLEIAGNLRMNTPTTVISIAEKNKLMPIFLDKKNILRVGSSEKIAKLVRLKINLNGNDKDFLYDLRLGLDPNKYTPVLANYRFLCMDDNTKFAMPLSRSNQPVLNIQLSKTTSRGRKKSSSGWNIPIIGPEDWVLYMDYYAVKPDGCENTRWEATLLVFYNEYLNNVVAKNTSSEVNDFEHPVKLYYNNDYNNSLGGYIGEIGETPVLVN